MTKALRDADEHCCRSPALARLYEANRDIHRCLTLGCSELPFECSLEFFNINVGTHKTKDQDQILFICWFALILKFQGTSLTACNPYVVTSSWHQALINGGSTVLFHYCLQHVRLLRARRLRLCYVLRTSLAP